MSGRTATANSGGVFLPLLAVLFVGLKLTGHIDWSWWWVLAPLWVPAAVCATFLAVLAVAFGVIELISTPEERAHRRAARALLKYRDQFGGPR